MIDARIIHETEAEMNRLHAACRAAAARQRSNAASRQEYRRAAEEFRNYQSPLWELWSAEAQRNIVDTSGPLRDAAILYLQISPRFFRSGYLRDLICTKLKQAELQPQERKDTQEALLRSIVLRPSTGSFRYDCRLAIKVADSHFLQELRSLSGSSNLWTSGRASRMEQAILRHAELPSESDI